MVNIQFAKTRDGAIIPSREKGNVGYDIYACFDEPYITIDPHTTKLISTGLSSIIPDGYAMILKDRGSTGTKGIPTACGVIDSNFRGEWFVALHNDNDCPVVIIKKESIDDYKFSNCSIIYPYEKAITQAILIQDIDSQITETSIETIEKNITNRGKGVIGSSGK